MTTITVNPPTEVTAIPIESRYGNIAKSLRFIARQWGWAALAILLIAYIMFLHYRFAPAISEPDDNGYFAQGTLLAQTGVTTFLPASEAQYIGMHWLIAPNGHYISRYPPGLAVVIAIIDKLTSWKSTLLLNPTLSVLTLIACFFLIRRALSTGWAIAAVAILGANPTFVHHALSGDSHMGVACVLTWGLYWLLRWAGQGRLWQAFLAGVCLGCIPSIRYADSIMAFGIIVFLLWNYRRFPKIWKHYSAAAIGALIPLIPLLIHNQILMGAFWRTGYSLTNEETGFSWAYFKEHAVDYLRQINGNGIGLLFAVGFVGMICMIFKSRNHDSDSLRVAARPSPRATGLMLLLMSLSMLLVYMAYYWAPQMNSAATLRFLLPTYPLYILAGLWLLKEAAGRTAIGTQTAVAISLVTFQLLWGTTELMAQSDQLHYQKQSLADVTLGLENVAKPGDIVVAEGNVLQQLDFVREWKVADGTPLRGGVGGGPGGGPGGGGFAGGDGRRAGGRGGFGGARGAANAQRDPTAPSPRQEAKVEVEREKYTGTTGQRQKKFIADLLAWAGQGHNIYFVGTPAEISQFTSLPGGSVKIISHIKLPPMPEPTETNDRRMGDGGGGAARRGANGPNAGGPAGRPGGGGPMGGFTGEPEVEIAEFIPKK